jgi:NAD(P)-dependent dehydrogenase (short-subunit alcohol dehydrogenase family)
MSSIPIRVLITGATSGIGEEAALQLARQGASLILPCRNLERGNATADAIARATGGARPDVLECDTGDQRSIRRCAAEVRAKFDRLDVLVNDAGTQHEERRLSPDGIEATFATNVLGYFLLTNELLDLLKASAPSRIVNVASTYAGGLDLEDLELTRRPYGNIPAYKQSKQANRMLTWALARRLKGTSVTANAMSPGLVMTGLYRDMTGFRRLFMRALSKVAGRTIAQGADTAVWLATSPEVLGISNKFWDQRKERRCEFRDEASEERLWKICETYVARSA